jgi:hypothetical protein
LLGVTPATDAGERTVRTRKERICARAGLTPRLSETRSDDQELREADAARRGLGNRERNCGESGAPETRGESERKEPG